MEIITSQQTESVKRSSPLTKNLMIKQLATPNNIRKYRFPYDFRLMPRKRQSTGKCLDYLFSLIFDVFTFIF